MANYTILLVDDDQNIIDQYSEELTVAGYDVVPCTNERDAKTLIHEKPSSFDLAVIDIRLRREVVNDESGFEVAKAIKRDIPLIIFSENLDPDRIMRALNLAGEGAKRDARPFRKSDGAEKLVELIRKILPPSCLPRPRPRHELPARCVRDAQSPRNQPNRSDGNRHGRGHDP